MFEKKSLTELDLKILKEKFPDNYQEKIKKAESGYPIQYLIGNVEFLNTTIEVNESVLIPRFETEYLVEKVLKKIKKTENMKMIDICCGSGCIAIAIAKNTKCLCSGIDISKSALEVANKNNFLNNTEVRFKKEDILKKEVLEDYDIIVSNPPYLKKEEVVDKETKFEPQIALFAEHNGLLFYEHILKIIKNKPKLIAFEIGENQSDFLKQLAKKYFYEAKITIETDLCGKKRFLFIEHD